MASKIKFLAYITGPTFLLLSIFLFFSSYNKLNTFVHTNAKVVGLHNVRTHHGPKYYPELVFTTTNGEAASFEYDSMTFKTLAVGENVPILYNSQNPNDVILNSFSELWYWPLISLMVGIIGIAALFKLIAIGFNTPFSQTSKLK